MFKEIKRVFKDTTVYGLGSMLPKAAGIILVPIYTRFLVPADYGLMSLATMVTSMVGTIMLVGQNGSLTLYFRATQTEGNEEEIRSLLFSVVAFVMLFAGVIFGLAMVFGPSAAPHLIRSKAFTFNPYLVVALSTAYLGLPLALLQAVNRARGQAATHTAFQLTSFALNTAFTLYFVVAVRQGALGSLKGTLAAAMLLALPALVLLAREMRPAFSWKWLRRSLVFGLPLVPHFFAGWILTFADRYMLERYTTLREVGLYSLAYNISMVMNLVSVAINQAWGPIYYDLAGREDGRKMLPRLTTVYAAVVTAAGMAFMLLARELLLFLAASRYHEAAGVVPIVVAGYWGFAMYSVVSTGIFYAKKTGWVPLISAIAAAFNIGLNWWLIPRYGMFAAAWNTFAAYLLMAAISRVVSGRLSPVGFEDARLAKTAAIFLGVFAAGLGVTALGLPLLATVVLKLVVLAIGLAAFVALDVITPRELRQALDRVRARRGRLAPDEEAALAALSEETAGHTADDTGFEHGER